jgi:hypothetical protein
VELQIGLGTDPVLIRGRVERCYVASLGPGEVRYRAAVRFDSPIGFTPPDNLMAGYPIPERRTDERASRGQTLPKPR